MTPRPLLTLVAAVAREDLAERLEEQAAAIQAVAPVATMAPIVAEKPRGAAMRKVCTTGRRNTSRSPHQPAPQANTAPAAMPTANKAASPKPRAAPIQITGKAQGVTLKIPARIAQCSGELVNLRCPYHAMVMKMLEPINKTMGDHWATLMKFPP